MTMPKISILVEMALRLSKKIKMNHLEILDIMAPLPKLYYQSMTTNGCLEYKQLSWASIDKWDALPNYVSAKMKEFAAAASFLPYTSGISPFNGEVKNHLQIYGDEQVIDRIIYRKGDKTTFYIADAYPKEWSKIMESNTIDETDSSTVEMALSEITKKNDIGTSSEDSDDETIEIEKEPSLTAKKISQLTGSKKMEDSESELIEIGGTIPGVMAIPIKKPKCLTVVEWSTVKNVLSKYKKISNFCKNWIYVGPDDEFSKIEQDELDFGFLDEMEFKNHTFKLCSDDEDAFNSLEKVLKYFDYTEFCREE